jgi:signal transduction histidine kinase
LESNDAQLGPRAKQALGLLGGDLRRFQRMVDDLLEISRMDAGSAELLLDEVEVNELVHQLAASSAANVPVTVDPTVANLRIPVDKRRIERIVANLIANAEHYAGGATGLSAEPGDGSVLLVVSDRGPGVAPDERDRIFERFYRGEAAGKRGATDGSGLGLSLVAEHMRLHGGNVWVEEGPGGENRFVAELPMGSAENVSSDGEPEETG